MLNLNKLTVLVMQKNPEILDILKFSLEAMQFKKIHTAYDGEAGYRLYLKENPDFIITGWEMDRLSGPDFAARLRQNKKGPNRQVPIIFLTGYSSEIRVKEALRAGITGYVIKPYTAETLSDKISYVINHPKEFIETDQYYGPNYGFIRAEASQKLQQTNNQDNFEIDMVGMANA